MAISALDMLSSENFYESHKGQLAAQHKFDYMI